MSSKKDQLGWQCETCQKKYSKETDKVMECEFCESHFCIGCLDMSPTTYNHHSKSSAMWFCVACMPKIKETIKIEKDIEKNAMSTTRNLRKSVVIWKQNLKIKSQMLNRKSRFVFIIM